METPGVGGTWLAVGAERDREPQDPAPTDTIRETLIVDRQVGRNDLRGPSGLLAHL